MSEAAAPRSYYFVASRNAMAAVIARLAVVAVGIVLTPFVLGKLRAELYGLVVVAFSVYNYLSLLRGGMGGALRWFVTLHHHGGRPDQARAFYAAGFWWAAILRTTVLVIALVLAWPLTGFFHLDQQMRPEAALGMGLIFLASIVGDQGSFFGIPVEATGRTAAVSLVEILGTFARALLIFAALSWVGQSLGVYGGALVAAECTITVVLLVLAHRARTVGPVIPTPQLGDRQLRQQLFRYGGWTILAQAAVLLYVAADNLMIGCIYGTEQVTHYSLGARWSPLVRGFLTASVSGLTPILTSMEARGEADRGRLALLRVVAVTSALAVSACLVPCVVGDLFLVHWVGSAYRDSAVYLIAMLAPLALEGALAPLWMGLEARGRIAWVATADIVVALANVVLSLVLALGLGMGLLGFALGNTAALLAKNLLLRPLAARRDPTMPQLGPVLRIFIAALFGGMPGLAMLFVLRPLYGGSLIAVIVAGMLGGALTLVGALLGSVGARGVRELASRIPLALAPQRP